MKEILKSTEEKEKGWGFKVIDRRQSGCHRWTVKIPLGENVEKIKTFSHKDKWLEM